MQYVKIHGLFFLALGSIGPPKGVVMLIILMLRHSGRVWRVDLGKYASKLAPNSIFFSSLMTWDQEVDFSVCGVEVTSFLKSPVNGARTQRITRPLSRELAVYRLWVLVLRQ